MRRRLHLLWALALVGATALTRPSQGEEAERGPGSLYMPPFRTHDHVWEWVDSAALERPLVVLLVNPLESGGTASVSERMGGMNALAEDGLTTLVVTWRGNFGANREFARRHEVAMPVLFSLPDPALATWVEGWTQQLPIALLFLDTGPAVAWGDPVALGAVARDLRAGVDMDDPAYKALLRLIPDAGAPVPPAPPSLLGAWLQWREFRAAHVADLRLDSEAREVDWDYLLEEGRLLLAWAPALSDSLLRRQMDEWFQRVTTSPLPEGVGAAAVLDPLAASLAGLSSRLSPGFRGWLHLMHGRPVAAYDEFVLAAATDTTWVDAIHILVAAAADPDQEYPVASAADLAFALYREVPPNERGDAFSHLRRDLRRVRAWWGESKDLPPAYDFTLGMSLLYLGQAAAPDYLDPLRQDPVWGPLVERLDALLGGSR